MIPCLPQIPWSGPQRFLHRLVSGRFRLGFGLLFLLQPLQGWGAGADPENFFETKIRPLLSQACYDCHSESRKKSKGGLFLDRRESLLIGGESGPSLVPGKADQSLIIRAVRYQDPDLQMPPDQPLSEQQIVDLEQWIDQGAPFPERTQDAIEADQKPWWETTLKTTLPSLESDAAEVIDTFVLRQLQELSLTPSPMASESIRIRRVYLDLMGRPPTPSELQAFLFDPRQDKWNHLVEDLMQSDDFLHQQIRELNWSLMGENHSEFGKYLQTVWKEGKGWDQLYQEVILADYRNDQASGAPAFLKKRVSDLDRLTNDVAIQFFGVNISCAQCHDHPNVPHWTQASYYGMKSFFSATFDNGGFVAERSEGEVTYKNTRGETLEASLQFFDRPPIEETLLVRLDDEGRKKEKERLEQLKKEKKPASLPSSSRRKLLVQEGLANAQGGYFARSAVNRIWKQFMGRGLVEPVDQMHGANPPTHPELLLWLSQWFQHHGHDPRQLIAALVRSQTYQRSSQWLTDPAPPNESFARFIVRPLTPRQYASALHLASSDPHDWLALSSDSPEHAKHLTQTMKGIDGTTQWFERTSDQVHFAVDEALQMSNASELEAMLHAQEAQWIEACALHEPSNKALNLVFRHILQRSPTLNEQETSARFMDSYPAGDTTPWKALIWSLATGPENRLQH